jgi:serine/threonine protein kinase
MGSILSYPHAKIADFGLSTITSNHDPNNTAAKQQKIGSAYWRPPEMRTIHMPPSTSTNPFPTSCFDSAGIPLPEELIHSTDQHAYTPAGNTFVVGFMMYQWLTLDEPDFMHDYLNRILAQLEDTPSSLLDTSSTPIRTRFFTIVSTPYSLISQIGQTESATRQDILDMLLVWQDAEYSCELKALIE